MWLSGVELELFWSWAQLGSTGLCVRLFRSREFRHPIQSVAAPLCVGHRNPRLRSSSNSKLSPLHYKVLERSRRIYNPLDNQETDRCGIVSMSYQPRKIATRCSARRHSDGHMHTDSLCTGSVPSGSVAPLCFHHHHLITYLPHALGHGVTVHRAACVARPGLSVERPPIRPVFRVHTRSSPRSSGAPSRRGVGTSIPDHPAVIAVSRVLS
jgi:hypothetical protein